MGSETVLPLPLLCNLQIGFTASIYGIEVLADGYSDGLLRSFYFYNTSALLSVAVLLPEMARNDQESLVQEAWLECLIYIGLGAALSVTAFFFLLYHRRVKRRVQVLGRYA